MRQEIAADIRSFIVAEVLEDVDDSELPPDVPLLSGVLDSFGLMSLLSYLEDRYDLAITNDQVVAKNFESIATLASFVEAQLLVEDRPGPVAAAS